MHLIQGLWMLESKVTGICVGVYKLGWLHLVVGFKRKSLQSLSRARYAVGM